MKKFFSLILALAVIVAMAVPVCAASATKVTTLPGSQQVILPKDDKSKQTQDQTKALESTKSQPKPGSNGRTAAVDASSVGTDSSKNTDFVHVPVDFKFFGPVELSDVGSDNVTYKGNPYIYIKGADIDIDVNVNVLSDQVKK